MSQFSTFFFLHGNFCQSGLFVSCPMFLYATMTQDHFWCLFLNIVNMWQVEKKNDVSHTWTQRTQDMTKKKKQPAWTEIFMWENRQDNCRRKNPMYHRTAPYCTEIAMLLHCNVSWKLNSFQLENVAMLRWLAAESNSYIGTTMQLGCSINGP